jgi:hypothetical protein
MRHFAFGITRTNNTKYELHLLENLVFGLSGLADTYAGWTCPSLSLGSKSLYRYYMHSATMITVR